MTRSMYMSWQSYGSKGKSTVTPRTTKVVMAGHTPLDASSLAMEGKAETD